MQGHFVLRKRMARAKVQVLLKVYCCIEFLSLDIGRFRLVTSLLACSLDSLICIKCSWTKLSLCFSAIIGFLNSLLPSVPARICHFVMKCLIISSEERLYFLCSRKLIEFLFFYVNCCNFCLAIFFK